jgi:hypothetical protein
MKPKTALSFAVFSLGVGPMHKFSQHLCSCIMFFEIPLVFWSPVLSSVQVVITMSFKFHAKMVGGAIAIVYAKLSDLFCSDCLLMTGGSFSPC